jgi:ATP-dependent Clp protease ATP-binding subunit ClpA
MPLNEFNPDKAIEALERASIIAKTHTHEYVTLEHLLASVMQDQQVLELLSDLNINIKKILDDLDAHFASEHISKSLLGHEPRQTSTLGMTVQRAIAHSMFSGRKAITGVDLLLSLLNEDNVDSHALYFLKKNGIDSYDIKLAVSHNDFDEEDDGDVLLTEGDPEAEGSTRKHRTKAERVLDKYCDNLNEQAKAGKIDPLIGREEEVYTLVLATARRTKNNVVLVGEPGVGKTAIAEGLAKQIVDGQVPEAIKDSIVYSLSIGNLMAGTKFRGDMEERIKQILEAIEQRGEELGIVPILFIDEIHTMMGAGSGNQGALDVANLLKPALAKGKLRCIGGTTYEEYRKHFEKDRALLRRFQKLDVLEPSIEDAKRIIAGISTSYTDFHGVTYEPAALDAAVELTARYVTNRFLPDKAIDVIDAAGARQKIRPEAERQTVITVELIEEEVAKIAKIPARTVKEDENAKLEHLDKDLHGVVFGQDNAIEEVVDAVLLSRAGLRDPSKPLGNYLFAGPTGVGKTELTKQLAKTLGIPLHRFDMSEYMEKHSVSKFIGAPPGYVGFGDGQAGSGLLTNAVEQSPHCVVLLDEIEKAHPDLYNILLQVMDNGELTNSSGKTVSFRNVILIMTTNAGASELQKNTLGFGSNSIAGNDDKVIERMFAPEFRNRLDALIKFSALKSENMLRIVDKFIDQLNELAAAKNVVVNIDQAVKEWLAKEGYDPKMGARPLSRLIQSELKKPLSRRMLFGNLKNGGHAHVVMIDGKVVIS